MFRRRFCCCVVCAVAAAIAALFLLTDAPAARAADKPLSFINDVAPILKENCFACHDAKKKAGKYDMTTFEKLMAGGANGEPVTAGDAGESDFHDLMVTADAKADAAAGQGRGGAQGEGRRRRPLDQGGGEARRRPRPEGRPRQGDCASAGRRRRRLKAYPFPAVVNALAFTPDGKELVVGGHHELTVWNLETGKLTKRVHTRAERAYGLVFLPDGKLVAAGGRPGQEGDVRVYDLNAPGKAEDGVTVLDGVNDPRYWSRHLLDVDDSVLALALSPDGKKLAAGGCDRAVRVWDVSGGVEKAKLEQTVENHADWVLGVALTADGKYLLTAGRDKTAKVWDLKAKESVLTFPDHQAVVYGVAAKADGSGGYSVGADKNLRAWKLTASTDTKGKKAPAGGNHADEVFKVVLSPAGPVLATATADKQVRLFNADTLVPTYRLAGLTDYVYALAFSPDGRLVAAGSYDGEVRVWKAADGSLVRGFNASPGYVAKTAAADGKK